MTTDARGGAWPWAALCGLIAFSAGLVWDRPLLVHLAYLLFLLLLLTPLYVALVLRGCALAYHPATDRLVAGELFVETYELRSRGIWPLPGVVVAALGEATRTQPEWLVSLGPRSQTELSARSPAPFRGRYDLGGAVVTASDPFGVIVRRRLFSPSHEVVVWPRARPVPGFDLAAARSGDLLPARRSWAAMPVTGAVRPFAQGDPTTRIHWLSTVRHGFLMVKDSERAAGQRLWVVLDLASPAHWSAGPSTTVEYAVEAAAYVAATADEVGLDVGLLVSGAEVDLVEPRRGRMQQGVILDVLATATAPVEQGDAALLEDLLTEQRLARASDAVVLLTPAVSFGVLDLLIRLHGLGCGVAVILVADADTPPSPSILSHVALMEELDAAHIALYRLDGEEHR